MDGGADPGVLSAEPERIGVSVFGARTQLDVSLPLDLPVSNVTPDLARLIRSRDAAPADDVQPKEDRRTFWVLSRFDDGTEIAPDRTLREAGVENGELLRLSAHRALSPPTLYDDVVDAAARLNKAAYAEWDATSARWLAFLGTHLCAIALAIMLCQPLSTVDRLILTGIGVVVVIALTTFSAVVHRSFGQPTTAAALSAATIPVNVVLIGLPLTGFGGFGLAGACAALIVVNYVIYRVTGAGPWALLASSVVAGMGGVALLSTALGAPADLVCVLLALVSLLMCAAVPRFTARLEHFAAPVAATGSDGEEGWALANPFPATATLPAPNEAGSIEHVPTAEAVQARVNAAALTGSALLLGLSATLVAAGTGLLRTGGGVGWPEFAFTLCCTAVLALRSRFSRTWKERTAAAVPALALAAVTCWYAQSGVEPLPVVAVAVALTIVAGAVLLGLTNGTSRSANDRRTRLLGYLDYLTVGALLPLAVWAVGGYQHLGPW